MIEVTLVDKTVAMLRYGAKSSRFHDLIRSGLMIPPVHVGRSARYPLHEINALASAKMAGVSDDEIRKLVSDLVGQRAVIFKEWKAAALAVAA